MKISRAQRERRVRRDGHYGGAGHSGKWKLSNGTGGWRRCARTLLVCHVTYWCACFCDDHSWLSSYDGSPPPPHTLSTGVSVRWLIQQEAKLGTVLWFLCSLLWATTDGVRSISWVQREPHTVFKNSRVYFRTQRCLYTRVGVALYNIQLPQLFWTNFKSKPFPESHQRRRHLL